LRIHTTIDNTGRHPLHEDAPATVAMAFGADE